MTWLWIALGALGWIACAVLAYGRELAYWNRQYPTLPPTRPGHVIATSIAGPIALLMGLCAFGIRHGFMWTMREVERRETLRTLAGTTWCPYHTSFQRGCLWCAGS